MVLRDQIRRGWKRNLLIGRWSFVGIATVDFSALGLGTVLIFTEESMSLAGATQRVIYQVGDVFPTNGIGLSFYFETDDSIYQEFPIIGKVRYRRIAAGK